MSDDREQGRGAPSAQPPGVAQGAAPEQEPPSAEELIAEDEEARGPINLERYFTQRRPAVRVSVVHLVTIVLMLAALVMIFSFKNRCGLMVANMFERVSGPAQPGAAPTPAGPDASRP